MTEIAEKETIEMLREKIHKQREIIDVARLIIGMTESTIPKTTETFFALCAEQGYRNDYEQR